MGDVTSGGDVFSAVCHTRHIFNGIAALREKVERLAARDSRRSLRIAYLTAIVDLPFLNPRYITKRADLPAKFPSGVTWPASWTWNGYNFRLARPYSCANKNRAMSWLGSSPEVYAVPPTCAFCSRIRRPRYAGAHLCAQERGKL